MATRMNRIALGLFCAVFFVLAGISATRADVLTFSPPDFVWSHPAGGASPNHIWITGDSWSQDFTGTGVASADHADLHLFIDDNILTTGNQLDLNLVINSTTVGSF